MRNDIKQILFELYAPTKYYGEEVFGHFYKKDGYILFINNTECTAWVSADTNKGFAEVMFIANVGDGIPQFVLDSYGGIITKTIYGNIRVFKEK